MALDGDNFPDGAFEFARMHEHNVPAYIAYL